MSALSANRGRGQQSTKAEVLCGHWDRLHNLFRDLFPLKTAAHLAELTGLSISAWQKSLRERRSVSSDALASLFRSPIGPRVITALVGDDCKEPWYVDMRVRERRREIDEWERELRGIDADYAREAAVAHRDEALRALGQVGARQTLASVAKRRS